ncbi:MAG: hypothetical protein ACM3N4_05835, partial [Nitrososphaerota archaeon]
MVELRLLAVSALVSDARFPLPARLTLVAVATFARARPLRDQQVRGGGCSRQGYSAFLGFVEQATRIP